MLVIRLYPFYFKSYLLWIYTVIVPQHNDLPLCERDQTNTGHLSKDTCPCKITEQTNQPGQISVFILLTNTFLWFFPLRLRGKKIFLALRLCSLCLQPVNLAEDLRRLWAPLWIWVGLNEQVQMSNLWQPWFHFIFSYQLLTGELLLSLVAHDVIFKKILPFPVLHYYFPTVDKLAFISVMAPVTCCGMLYLELCLGEPSHQKTELFIY